MRRLIYLIVGLCGIPTTAGAYIDAAPTLGRVLHDSTHVVVLQVEQVSREKRVILYRKTADLKGQQSAEQVRHQLGPGLHPREAQLILDWAEPGRRAVCFHNGKVAQVCIDRYWYECVAADPSAWRMTSGQPQLCFAYHGRAERLAGLVEAMLTGRQVVVPAIEYGADNDAYWRACKEQITFRGLPQGSQFPVWRVKASLRMPGTVTEVAKDFETFVAGWGTVGKEDVPALLKALKHDDARVRAEAAADLGSLGGVGGEAAPVLVQLLKDSEPVVRIRAAAALLRIDPKNTDALPVLTESLKERAGKVRKTAAEALAEVGPEARAAVPALAAVLRDDDAGVRWAAAEALGRIGPDAAPAIPALIELLRHDDASTRGAAGDALGWIGPKARSAVPALTAALKDPDEGTRWSAALALVRIEKSAGRAAVPLLVQALESKESRARWMALACLWRMDWEGKEAVPIAALSEALRDPDVGVRSMAAICLGNVGRRARDAGPTLRATLRDRDWYVRTWAAWALAQVSGAEAVEAVPALIDGLENGHGTMRPEMASALGAIGPAARDALPALTRAARDGDDGLRTAAAAALKRIQPR